MENIIHFVDVQVRKQQFMQVDQQSNVEVVNGTNQGNGVVEGTVEWNKVLESTRKYEKTWSGNIL